MEGTHKIAGYLLNAALLLMFLGLVTRTEAGLVVGGDCGSVRTNISACTNLLGINLQIGSPSSECCVGLQNIAQAAVNIGNATTCRCLRSIPQLFVAPRLNGQILNMAYGLCRYTLGINGTATAGLPLQCLS